MKRIICWIVGHRWEWWLFQWVNRCNGNKTPMRRHKCICARCGAKRGYP